MFSPEQIIDVQNFIKQTPEKNLRQMLIKGGFTDVHMNLLLKIARNSSEEEFVELFNNEKMPQMKYSANEMKVREAFWDPCKNSLTQMGLLTAQKAA